MTIHFGSMPLGLVSSLPAFRVAAEKRFGAVIDGAYARTGLLLGQSTETRVGNSLWAVYESGDIALHRGRDEDLAIDAALSQLQAVHDAVQSTDPSFRLRTILTPDGDAILVQPAMIHKLAGGDRALRSRGYDLLPSTIATIRLTERRVNIPSSGQDGEPRIESAPIREIILSDRDDAGKDALLLLAVMRAVFRPPGTDFGRSFDDALIVSGWTDIVSLQTTEQTEHYVRSLGRKQR